MAWATDLWVLHIQLMFIVLSILYCAGFASPGITSSFVRSQWPSVDIPLDNEVFAIPKGYNAPQQVSKPSISVFFIIIHLCID
ncbi:hypothetical protein ZOSMA_182G00550 [Zostera marina]|uniref:Uncharacterized protein n=1 Tax=Zostera marina TaxID=29655 RepID=A0A0K9PQX0_ZOSMR|nr:hypothetical protein ZOSMA_182G00550 [Zostera marina]